VTAERGLPDFDPERLLETLQRHEVRFVVVGQYAAQLRGARRPTTDVDVTPAGDAGNLERLAAALRELEAKIRTDEAGRGTVDLPYDGRLLGSRETTWNLVTRFGNLDLVMRPAGSPNGYADLSEAATSESVGEGLTVEVASLEDVIRSKAEAGRAKDFAALEELEALRRGSAD
jgi:hypothetical protein